MCAWVCVIISALWKVAIKLMWSHRVGWQSAFWTHAASGKGDHNDINSADISTVKRESARELEKGKMTSSLDRNWDHDSSCQRKDEDVVSSEAGSLHYASVARDGGKQSRQHTLWYICCSLRWAGWLESLITFPSALCSSTGMLSPGDGGGRGAQFVWVAMARILSEHLIMLLIHPRRWSSHGL